MRPEPPLHRDLARSPTSTLASRLSTRRGSLSKPSLEPMVLYLVDECVKRLPNEICPVCEHKVLPNNPANLSKVPHNLQAERIYCGHFYHNQCLTTHLSIPPFEGGKKCLVCDKLVAHHKFTTDASLLERRWVCSQAHEREIADVIEFFNT
mmetsp:Transcript_11191/g.15238  ORF Transcript_11191/g.15238 Transcript_11191/m.15238 type:complete len:151 (-) Transcript_11191:142-594(-)